MSVSYETQEERDNAESWIARRPKCGHIVGACVDSKDPTRLRDVSRTVSGWIRANLKVERMSVVDVRTAKWCDCPRPAQGRR